MIIEARYNGPPGSGNGGWSAGIFATAVGGTGRDAGSAVAPPGTVEVTLRRPPPLGVPLRTAPSADQPGRHEVHDPDGTLVAQVAPVAEFTPTVPGVDLATARAASADYAGFTAHPFPGCYVCGPEYPDGLRIFPGRLPDGRTAAPFRVPAEVRPETVWAALDCPGGWAVIGPGRPYVLGRIAVRVVALPRPGDECVVTGAAGGGEGRKALVHSSLYAPDGALLAHARATWIALPAD
ncbi:hypothetical protein [Micromonospora echinospora]|uniref:hypothetical protein n=1 Tax=Micromonospora echinospora TaxID=1877 RepID=UPI003A8ADC2E